MKSLATSLLSLYVCVPLAAGEADLRRRAKEEAQAMVAAFFKGDYDRFVSYMPATGLQKLGGREKAAATMKEFMEKSKVKVLSITVSDATDLVKKGKRLFAVLPITQVMEGLGTRTTARDHLLGSSEDGGKTWIFINRAKMSREAIRELLPEFPKEVKLPPPNKQTIEKTM